uniref:CUB domain-containing protein n=1 Tax=Panagrellus redivivus TaxID=6233 RepID=A0A7E4W228_PANRE
MEPYRNSPMVFNFHGFNSDFLFHLHRYTEKSKGDYKLEKGSKADCDSEFYSIESKISNAKMVELGYHTEAQFIKFDMKNEEGIVYPLYHCQFSHYETYWRKLYMHKHGDFVFKPCIPMLERTKGYGAGDIYLTFEARQPERGITCPVYFSYHPRTKIVEQGGCLNESTTPEPVIYTGLENGTALEIATKDHLNVLIKQNLTKQSASITIDEAENLFFWVENLKKDCPLMFRVKHHEDCNDWRMKLEFYGEPKCTVEIEKKIETVGFRSGTHHQIYEDRYAKTEFEFFLDRNRFTVMPTGIYHTLFLDFCEFGTEDPQVFSVNVTTVIASGLCGGDNMKFEIVDNAVIRAPLYVNTTTIIPTTVEETDDYDEYDNNEIETTTSDERNSKRLPAYFYAIVCICAILLLMVVGMVLYNVIPSIVAKRKAKKEAAKAPIATPDTTKQQETVTTTATAVSPIKTDQSSVVETTKQSTVDTNTITKQKTPQKKARTPMRRARSKARTPSRRILSAEDIRDVVDSPMAILPPTSTVKRLKHVHFITNYTYPPTMVNYNTVKQPLIHVKHLYQVLPFTNEVEVPIEDHVYFRYRDLTTENNSAFRHFRTRLLEPSFDDEAPIIAGTTLMPVIVRVYVLDHDPPAFELHFPNNVPPEFVHKLTGCRLCQQYASLQTIPTYYSSSQYIEAVDFVKKLATGTHTYINVDTLPQDANKEEIMSVYVFRSIPPQDTPKTPKRSPLQQTDHRHTVKLRALDDAELTAHGILLTKFIVTPVKVAAFDTSHMSQTGAVSSTTPLSSLHPDSTTLLDSTNQSDFSTKSNKSNVSSKSTKGTKQLS